jgi:four helix bundle protein
MAAWPGSDPARRSGVIARRFEDLVVWQLAFELQKEVLAFTAIGPAWHDVKYRDQIRDSSASATRNTAEGFGRFRPTEFARFLEIAHGSLDETRSHLHDGLQRGYLSTTEHRRLEKLARRALGANARLGRYLRSCKRPPDGGTRT